MFSIADTSPTSLPRHPWSGVPRSLLREASRWVRNGHPAKGDVAEFKALPLSIRKDPVGFRTAVSDLISRWVGDFG